MGNVTYDKTKYTTHDCNTGPSSLEPSTECWIWINAIRIFNGIGNTQSLIQDWIDKLSTNKQKFGNKNSVSFFNMWIKVTAAILKTLKIKKTQNISEISRHPIKCCYKCIIGRITEVINCCLLEGKFPKIFKVSKLLPIHNNCADTIQENFRQIHILPASQNCLKPFYLNKLSIIFTLNLFFGEQYVSSRDGSTCNNGSC